MNEVDNTINRNKLTINPATDDIGHRDGAYFELSKEDQTSSTGMKYTVYWLTDHKGNRAPDSVYQVILQGKLERRAER